MNFEQRERIRYLWDQTKQIFNGLVSVAFLGGMIYWAYTAYQEHRKDDDVRRALIVAMTKEVGGTKKRITELEERVEALEIRAGVRTRPKPQEPLDLNKYLIEDKPK